MSNPDNLLTAQTAKKMLAEYSCNNNSNLESSIEKEKIRQALLLITNLCEWQNLGICADNSTEGFEALLSYLQALGYESNFNFHDFPTSDKAVYIKYNGQKMSYFLDSYLGEYRGVLISCQSEDDNITGTYGHFPLDLFK
jgi:hypothetical protein